MRVRVRVQVLLAVGLFAGCGKPPPPPIVPAEGLVRLDGRPLKHAQVRFLPAIGYGAEYVAVGVTDDNGRFKLTCQGQPGACSGETSSSSVKRRCRRNCAAKALRRPWPATFKSSADGPCPPSTRAWPKTRLPRPSRKARRTLNSIFHVERFAHQFFARSETR